MERNNNNILKYKNMKVLVNKFTKLDIVEKVGTIVLAVMVIPAAVGVTIDVIINGSNLL